MPIIATERETGHLGRLVSLGGVVGRPGTGRRVDDYTQIVTGSTVLIMPANPYRLWASFFNREGGVVVLGPGPDYFVALEPGGFFLINESMPWTGAIYAGPASGSPQLFCFEAVLDIGT